MSLGFYEHIKKLKTTLRRGWIARDVPGRTESVADHSFAVALICLSLSEIDPDTRARATEMSLVHDLAESVVGDIIPADNISHDQKFEREQLAINYIACELRIENPDYADKLVELWHEYEGEDTLASRIVRQVDKLECIGQAVAYASLSEVDLEEFMDLKQQVTLPQLQPILRNYLSRYEQLKEKKAADHTIVFVVGGPGVGKSTQCAFMAREFGFQHISVGDLLRKEQQSETSLFSNFIAESFKKSIAVPPQLTTRLIKKEMQTLASNETTKFLLDGFPRSLEQVADFEKEISARYVSVQLFGSETKLQARLQQRANSSGRSDDTPDVITKRLRTFQESNKPILHYLREHGTIHSVNCDGTIEEVNESIRLVAHNI